MAVARELIRDRLRADPERSNRSLASQLGITERTVREVRQVMEQAGEIPVVTHTRSQDGRRHPRRGLSQTGPRSAGPVAFPSPQQLTPGRWSSTQALDTAFGTREPDPQSRKFGLGSPDSTQRPDSSSGDSGPSPEVLPFLQNRYGRSRRRAAHASSDSVLAQIRTAFTGHPLAFLVALPFGGFVPLAVWCLTHLEAIEPWDWALIAGGALFSSLTVIDWGRRILLNTPKAIGFAFLVEGVMITSKTDWLSLSALGLLIIVNSVACAVALAPAPATSTAPQTVEEPGRGAAP